MRKIIVVTNRDKQESVVLRQQLMHQYPTHELALCPTHASLIDTLEQLPDTRWPHLILLDQLHTKSDVLSSLKELKAHPRFRPIPVLMLNANATYHKIRLNGVLAV
jgi:CheY-like chemotaxis protein